MSQASVVHVIGAGLAGLSAAVRLAEAGRVVRLWEAGAQAGGRCRSYVDDVLGCRIDNGNHMLLSGNTSALAYLRTIGAADSLIGPAETIFPFIDLETNERWTLRPGSGRLPFWLFDPARRVAGTGPSDYLSGLRFLRAGPEETVASLLPHDLLYRRLWAPISVAVLNTEPEAASAALLWPVLRETFGRGGRYCRPLTAREGLSESFVYPALTWLAAHQGEIRFGARIRALRFEGQRVTGFGQGSETITLGPNDQIVLAVPPPVAASLLPGLIVPNDFRPILNAHFRLGMPQDELTITGVLGGISEWIFRRGDLVSVTVSASTRFQDDAAEDLAPLIWTEITRALALGKTPMPPWRIIREKRATFAQTPEQIRRRPATRTAWQNLVLAGDWTDNGLPATIEGTIRSGESAAKAILNEL